MAHARTLIRENVGIVLGSIAGLEAQIIYDETSIKPEGDAPFAIVQLGNETVSSRTISGKITRSLQLFVDLVGRDQHESLARLENFAALIEDRFAADPRLRDTVQQTRFEGIEIERSEEPRLVKLRLTFIVEYSTRAGAASVPV